MTVFSGKFFQLTASVGEGSLVFGGTVGGELCVEQVNGLMVKGVCLCFTGQRLQRDDQIDLVTVGQHALQRHLTV